MVDTARRGPLDNLARPRGAVVRALPTCTRFVLRGRPATITAASEALGLQLPQTPCRSASNSTLTALWLGPDEWLLLPAGSLPENLAPTLVDVSHGYAALEIEGPGSIDLLNAACPLDLSTFPPGACTRTVLGKTEIILWRTDTNNFRLEIKRSFAEYVWLLLQEEKTGQGSALDPQGTGVP